MVVGGNFGSCMQNVPYTFEVTEANFSLPFKYDKSTENEHIPSTATELYEMTQLKLKGLDLPTALTSI